jgi:2-hydroxychromene-2-carboxylate isomerase
VTQVRRRATEPHVYVYGRFDSPWAYLASRRLDRWTRSDVVIDWRAISHTSTPEGALRPAQSADVRRARLDDVRTTMELVSATLAPDETLPFALAGFVPYTTAAATAFAEAYHSGLATEARRTLFDALWLHGCDLDDAHEVRTLLQDARASAGLPDNAQIGPTGRVRRTVRTWDAESMRFAGPAGLVLVLGDHVLRDQEAADVLGSLLRLPGQSSSTLLSRSAP